MGQLGARPNAKMVQRPQSVLLKGVLEEEVVRGMAVVVLADLVVAKVQEKLSYLNDGNPSTNSDLGVTAICLLPVFSSVKYDGSDVLNYREVHPDMGAAEDLKNLVAAAHLRATLS